MKDLVIPQWREAPRMLSMQLAAAAVVFGSLPADAQASMLAAIGVPAQRVPAILGVLFMAGRMLGQGIGAQAPPPEGPPADGGGS